MQWISLHINIVISCMISKQPIRHRGTKQRISSKTAWRISERPWLFINTISVFLYYSRALTQKQMRPMQYTTMSQQFSRSEIWNLTYNVIRKCHTESWKKAASNACSVTNTSLDSQCISDTSQNKLAHSFNTAIIHVIIITVIIIIIVI
jgi:ATP-dependent Zn protease